MAYSAYRFLAAFCFFTIILSPFGVFFWWVANRKEKEREKEVEALEQIADSNTNK
jgi:preprotein translocase subunit YajC